MHKLDASSADAWILKWIVFITWSSADPADVLIFFFIVNAPRRRSFVSHGGVSGERGLNTHKARMKREKRLYLPRLK